MRRGGPFALDAKRGGVRRETHPGRQIQRDDCRWHHTAMDRLTFTRPDDWHLHLRDGDALRAVLPHSARQFGRAIVMPNLKPPVTTVEAAAAYRARIVDALPAGAT